MQKKIIALAVAALASTAAFAQTNVTIYGIADASISATSNLGANGGQTGFKVNSGTLSTSRIGFKGVEDLGNGLKALFVLEYGLGIDVSQGIGYNASASSAYARQQFVGLTGGFGTAVAGHLQTTGFDFTAATTALAGSTSLGAINVAANGNGGLINGNNLIAALGGGRQDNAVAYISPSFGGVSFAYNHARVTEKALTNDMSDAHGDLVSVSYDNGPITAGAIYTKVTNPQTVAKDNLKEFGLRAGYDFGVAKLQASFQEAKQDGLSGNDKLWGVSLSAPIGAKVGVIAEFAQNRIGTTPGKDNVNVGTLATTYALSKRTTAYAGFVAKRASNDTTRNTTTNPYLTDTNTYAVGLRHAF